MLTDTKWQFMARRDKKKHKRILEPGPRSHWERHITRPHVDPVLKVAETKTNRPDFRPVEDLRHAPEDKTFRLRSGRPARLETRPQGQVQKSHLHTPVYTYFQDPGRVLVCIRRHSRRRVLFALRKIGKGRRVSPRHHFSEQSYIRCK